MDVKQSRKMVGLKEKIDYSVYVATGNGIFLKKTVLESDLIQVCVVLLLYSYCWNQSHMFDLVLISFLHVRGS